MQLNYTIAIATLYKIRRFKSGLLKPFEYFTNLK